MITIRYYSLNFFFHILYYMEKKHWTFYVKIVQKNYNLTWKEAIEKWRELGKPKEIEKEYVKQHVKKEHKKEYVKISKKDNIIKNIPEVNKNIKIKLPFKYSQKKMDEFSNLRKKEILKVHPANFLNTLVFLMLISFQNENCEIFIPPTSDNKPNINIKPINQMLTYYQDKIIYTDEFINLVKKSKKRFILIPLDLKDYYHQNAVIIDNYDKTFEIFEPHGNFDTDSEKINYKKINDDLKKLSKKLNLKFEKNKLGNIQDVINLNILKKNLNNDQKNLVNYIYQNKKYGIQVLEELDSYDNNPNSDYVGLCQCYSTLYPHLIVLNPEYTPQEIMISFFNSLHNNYYEIFNYMIFYTFSMRFEVINLFGKIIPTWNDLYLILNKKYNRINKKQINLIEERERKNYEKIFGIKK